MMPLINTVLMLILFVVLIILLLSQLKTQKLISRRIAHLTRTVEKEAQQSARNRIEILRLTQKLDGATPEDDVDEEAEMKAQEDQMMADIVASLPANLKNRKADTESETAKEAIRAVGYSPEKILELLRTSLDKNTIEITAQPIMSLPQRRLRFYELYSRIPAGKNQYINAGQFIDLAAESEMLSAIDHLLLLKALQTLRKTETGKNTDGVGYVLNVAATTMNNTAFMADLTSFLASHVDLAPRLVFEFTQEQSKKLSENGRAVMDGLAKLGCRFAIDQVKVLGIDVSALEAKHITFVKIPAKTFLAELKDKNSSTRMRGLKNNLEHAGIDLIIERIETEKQVLQVLEYYVDYGQGYLFGKPQVLS